ncbi:kelch repeat protein [Cooperia oncophora]
MSTSRASLGSAALNGHLYAVGGSDEPGYSLNSVEEYNPLTNDWTRAPPMKRRRSHVGVDAVNGKIYAVGGYDGHTPHKSVDVYYAQENLWREHIYKEDGSVFTLCR